MRLTRIFLLVLLAGLLSLVSAAPRFVYLTFEGDTATSITVNFHTMTAGAESWVHFDTLSHGGQADAYANKQAGRHHKVPGLADGRDIHWVRLDNLQPDTTYYMVAGDAKNGWSGELKFRTLPREDKALRLVTGGDFGVEPLVGAMFRSAASHEPHVALLGGDVAYANGSLDNVGQWDEWLKLWTENMVTPNGYTVPLILAIGNHEVSARYGGKPEEAPFYYNYFAQGGDKAYFRRALGAHSAVYVLDSGHTSDHGGAQAEWLQQTMAADRDKVKNTFAIYHVPLYPSHRDYETKYSELGRRHWEPIFSRYQLTTAFENHDHTYKRSKRLRNGKVDPEGVLYIGDGAWGRGDRGIDLVKRWYLDKVGSMRHYWLVDFSTQGIVYRAFDKQGRLFDVYPAQGQETADADAYFQTVTQNISFDEKPAELSDFFVSGERFDGATLELRLHNREKVDAQAVVRIVADDVFQVGEKEHRFELKAGRRRVLEVPLKVKQPIGIESVKPPEIQYSLTFTVDGHSYTNEGVKRIGLEQRRVLKSREIVLDGDLSDWGEMRESFRNLDKAAMAKYTTPWGGPADAACNFSLFHDRKNVYIAVKVRDDKVVVSPELRPWRQDGLVFWVDSYPGEGDDDPNFAVVPMGADGLTADIDNAPEGLQAKTRRTETGYHTEIAIPVEFFRKRLVEEGGGGRLKAIRINFALADLDRPDGEVRYYTWRPAWEEANDFTWSGVYIIE